MTILGRVMIIWAAVVFGEPSQAQVPPPPPMPGQNIATRSIIDAIESKDVKRYFELMSDDLEVFQDGTLIARSKSDWLKDFGAMLATAGVRISIVSAYESTGRALLVEYYNTVGSWNRDPPAECCWGYDAVAYDFSGGKVIRILKLKGGQPAVSVPRR